MPQYHQRCHDDLKRKLRELKKLELKIRNRYMSDTRGKNLTKAYSDNEDSNIELVWNKFFNLKDKYADNVRYSIDKLSRMTKEEFKDIISEYFYHVFYMCFKEYGGASSGYELFDPELLAQLELPAYATADDIRKRFRELAKKYHPDNNGDNEKFIDLIEKYKNIHIIDVQ